MVADDSGFLLVSVCASSEQMREQPTTLMIASRHLGYCRERSMENEELSSHVHSGVSETQTGTKIPAVAFAKVSAALGSLCAGFAGCS